MPLSLDSYFGIHAKALLARDQRSSQLANNLANVNTPNYKAMDVDFNELLASQMAGNSQQMQLTSPNHLDATANFVRGLGAVILCRALDQGPDVAIREIGAHGDDRHKGARLQGDGDSRRTGWNSRGLALMNA